MCHAYVFLTMFLITLWYHTYGWYSHYGSTAVPIAVGSHNTDSLYHVVGYSDRNTCSTGENCSNSWTDSDGVVDWSSPIILWGLPLYCKNHTILTILLNSGGGGLRRRGETCVGGYWINFRKVAVTSTPWSLRCINWAHGLCFITICVWY